MCLNYFISPSSIMRPENNIDHRLCRKFSMLLLFAMILGTMMPGSQHVLCASQSLPIPKGPIINQNGSLESSGQIHDHPSSIATKLNSSSQFQIPIDVVFFDRISSSKKNKSDDWTLRHTYNISTTTLPQSSNATGQAVDKNETSDPMDVSDSRFVPQRLSSRLDYGESSGDDSNEYADESALDGFSDGASSNLIEKKVVKELTKILSRGMSGATDQIRLETLETLKRRQKERKIAKDTRAKAFEEILNTAINSHPDRVKKNSKSKNSGSGMKYSASSSAGNAGGSLSIPGLSDNPSVDSELSTDAETVLQHLQGLSSALDSQAPAFVANGGQTESEASDDSAQAHDNSNSSSAYSDDSSDSSDSGGAEEEKQAKKAPASSSDRPLVRQFKKIKNQISQRRKQLDQIKKLFNVELSINPKDGSLMGKPAGGKKKTNSAEEASSSDDVEFASSKRDKTASKNNYKVRDLMNYLRENPDILASIMSELTVDSDQTNKASFALSSREEGPYQAPSSLSEAADSSIPNLSSRKTITTTPHQRHHTSVEISGPDAQYWLNERARHQSRASDSAADLSVPEANGLASKISTRRAISRMQPQSYSVGGNSKSAEALLLASLRERQLLNLARLDMVLAERASQTSSNRSSTYSSVPQRLDRNDLSSRNYQSVSTSYDDRLGRAQYNDANDGGRNFYQRSDEEVAHHFMMVNQPSNKTSSETTWGSYQPQQARSSLYTASAFDLNPVDLAQQQARAYDGADTRSQQDYNTYRQQQHEQPLRRFRDWRDVGQSEASSWQSDKMPTQNATWFPYDLTTGNSASMSTTNHYTRSPSMLHYQSVMPHKPVSQDNLAPSMQAQMYGSPSAASMGINSTGANIRLQELTPTSNQLVDLSTTRPALLQGSAPPLGATVAPPYQQTLEPQSTPTQIAYNNMRQSNANVHSSMRQMPLTSLSPGVVGSDAFTVKIARDNQQSEGRGQKFVNEKTRQEQHQSGTIFDETVPEQGDRNVDRNYESTRGDQNSDQIVTGHKPHRTKQSVTDDYDFSPNTDYFGPYKQRESYRSNKRARSIDGHSSTKKSRTRQRASEMFDDDDEVRTTSTEPTPNDDDMGAIW